MTEEVHHLADGDGIVPLTDTEWFDDDACNRVIEFLSKAWPAEHLEANLAFLAENLSPKNESSRDPTRRYLNDIFFKNHLQGYKKRPIYWLFSSGKEKAFQCLVYLHRYNEGTLARMRPSMRFRCKANSPPSIDSKTTWPPPAALRSGTSWRSSGPPSRSNWRSFGNSTRSFATTPTNGFD